jgi:hypothetical protein
VQPRRGDGREGGREVHGAGRQERRGLVQPRRADGQVGRREARDCLGRDARVPEGGRRRAPGAPAPTHVQRRGGTFMDEDCGRSADGQSLLQARRQRRAGRLGSEEEQAGKAGSAAGDHLPPHQALPASRSARLAWFTTR